MDLILTPRGPRTIRDAARRRRAPSRDAERGERRSGIALLVVLVLFTILMLVVYQLQFSTKLEEELAEVRATDTLGTFAISSVCSHILTVIAEDFRESRMSASSAGGGAGAAGGQGGGQGEGGQRGPSNPTAGSDPGRPGGAGGGETGAPQAGGGSSTSDPGTYDYILKRVFQRDQKTIGGVTVRFRLVDNERKISLNDLWDYVRPQVDTLSAANEEQAEEDAQKKADEENKKKEDPSAAKKAADGAAGLDGESEEDLDPTQEEFVQPSEEKRELARQMLERIIDLTLRLNESRGFFYKFSPPNPGTLAVAIEDYCLQRRSQNFHNVITNVTELLNIPGIIPELFYGPDPEVVAGEPYVDPTGQYSYQRDEFGELAGEALLASDQWMLDREDRMAQLEELMAFEGPLGHFPGLGALGNPLTRSMEEFPEDIDGLGLLVPPQPIGLRDLFCTYSTRKLNLNTAPPQVIYGVLVSLAPQDAEKVALDLEAYRYLYQEEVSEEEAAGAVQGAEDGRSKDLGQPKRQRKEEEEEDAAAAGGGLGEEGADVTGMTSFENPETNYLTDLRQLVLIDGEDGSSEDLLRENEGVDVVDADFQSPFQLVKHDLEQIAVFGATYFTAELKIKTEKSPVVKEGELVIFRDLENRRIEILQYKEIER